jgi:hypothetical protein
MNAIPFQKSALKTSPLPFTPTLTLPRRRLYHNGGNAVIPAKAGIQVFEIVVVSN